MSAIRILLAESIDYAGLFPPAGLGMVAAVGNFAQYRSKPDAWALGRFVVPGSRLEEFAAAAKPHLQEAPGPVPWRLSVLAGLDVQSDIESVSRFTRSHAGWPVVADTLEVKASSGGAVEDIMRMVPVGVQTFIEIPVDRDPGELLRAMKRVGARAKVRTGGVTPDAFPTSADLLRFLQGCIAADVPFKATAGLHHPLRAEYRLTYAEDSPIGPMFGYLNLFLATAFLRSGLSEAEALRLLEERSPEAIDVNDDEIRWRGYRLDLERLRIARREGMISFGSCSFTEPLHDLQALQLHPGGAWQV